MSVARLFFGSALVAALVAVVLYRLPRIDIPQHMQNHKMSFIPDLISKQSHTELNALMRELAEYPSNIVADLITGGFVAEHEHVGEAQPIGDDGKCSHPFLVPNLNRTHCILAQRVDIGKHFVLTGGPDAIREPYNQMIDRLSSFGRYMFDIDKYPVITKLFSEDHFQAAARSVCPADQQVLDPFQFNFIIQVPGQTVASHIDAPYFWGASRRQFPQWLLACMVFSGLYSDLFVNQIQVVGYLHSWHSDKVGGDFIYFPTNSDVAKLVPATPRAGSVIDGSKTVHAALVYRPKELAPSLSKDTYSALRYAGNETWHLMVDENVYRVYDNNDLRVSIVYRARCFKSEEDKNKYHSLPREAMMKLEDVLKTLSDELIRRGQMTAQEAQSLSRLDLALRLIDGYIRYPLPAASTALIPYNYCALPRLMPWTKPVIDMLCK